ncbi:UNVERIFIED_CONTAM: hypothetical protein NCL1_35214 [Trichonephila clavipes]
MNRILGEEDIISATAQVSTFNLDFSLVRKSLPTEKTLSISSLVPGQHNLNSTRKFNKNN